MDVGAWAARKPSWPGARAKRAGCAGPPVAVGRQVWKTPTCPVRTPGYVKRGGIERVFVLVHEHIQLSRADHGQVREPARGQVLAEGRAAGAMAMFME